MSIITKIEANWWNWCLGVKNFHRENARKLTFYRIIVPLKYFHNVMKWVLSCYENYLRYTRRRQIKILIMLGPSSIIQNFKIRDFFSNDQSILKLRAPFCLVTSAFPSLTMLLFWLDIRLVKKLDLNVINMRWIVYVIQLHPEHQC